MTIKVSQIELLKVLKKNREVHRAIFEQALVGYRAKVIEKLDQMIADARVGRRIEQYVGLVEPIDQTKDYDRAIKMLEMSVNDTIEISEAQFAQYVLDDWSWKGQFTAINSAYLSK